MRRVNKFVIIVTLLASCKPNDNDIKTLLRSKDFNDRIEGAYKAGISGKKEYIPYLLENANDPSTSTKLQFKGFSVYQEKMMALKEILKVEPPSKITWEPDSVIIRFYIKAASTW
jgi:HEAT repeat protein